MLKAKFSTRAHLHGKNTSISAQTPTPPNCPETPANPGIESHTRLPILQNAVKARYSLIAIVREREGEGGDTNSVSVCATRVAINLKDNAMVHI